jgi:ABC-2 type transport system permease protein
MSVRRIWTLFLRYFYTTRDPARITEFLCWPVIDIGFFGLIAVWSGTLTQNTHIVNMFVTALVLWQVIYRANFEICFNVSDEFLDRNLMNIIASPMRKSEWIIAMMLNGLFKILFTLLFGALIGFLFFGVNVFAIGWWLLPFVLLCLVSGWIVGFFGGALVIYSGAKLQSLPWVVIMIMAIISAVFYPVSILNSTLAWIAKSLPMSYIFESMRQLLTTHSVSSHYWYLSTFLSIVYLAVAIKFFLFMFERRLRRGLARLS